MPIQLNNSEEKIFRYLVDHKTPVLAATLSKRFIMSKSHVSSVLKALHDKGLADIIKVGSNKFYKIKE